MPRDIYSPVRFTPFNGVLRVESDRAVSILEPSDAPCIVDIRNHGPGSIHIVQRYLEGRSASAVLQPGDERGGWVDRDVGLTVQASAFARVSVRRFRTWGK